MASVLLNATNYALVIATRIAALGSGFQIRGVDALESDLTGVKTFDFNQSGSILTNSGEVVFDPATSNGTLVKFQIYRPSDVIGTNESYLELTPEETGDVVVGSVIRIPQGVLFFDFNNGNVCGGDEGGWTPTSGADTITSEILACGLSLFFDVSANSAFLTAPAQVATLVATGTPADILTNTSTHTFTATNQGTLTGLFVSCGTVSSTANMLFQITFTKPVNLTAGQTYTINANDLAIKFNG